MKQNTTKIVFILKNIVPSGIHPPINNKLVNALISSILPYSPIKNKANDIEEYSTKYPATNSASASGKSKGGLFVSAKTEIKNKPKCLVLQLVRHKLVNQFNVNDRDLMCSQKTRGITLKEATQ